MGKFCIGDVSIPQTWEQRGLQGNGHSFIQTRGWFMYKDNTHLPDMAVEYFIKGAYVMSPPPTHR